MGMLGGRGDQTGPTWKAALRGRVSRAYLAVGAMAVCPQLDTERLRVADRQVARNRLMFGLAGTAYTWFIFTVGDLDSPVPAIINAVYLLLATSALFVTRLSPKRLDAFRKVMLFIDVSTISACFIAVGAIAAPLLFLYSWLTIGYGFRYGIYYLRLAAITSLGGIIASLLYTNFWHTQPFVAAGILMLAVIIPPYLEFLMRRAIQANEIARSANHSKALMLAGLGHALRVPLNSILTAAQAMSGGILGPAQGQTLSAIQVAAGSVMRELDDLLDVSRLDAGRMPKEVTSFSVKGLVTEALAIAAAQAAPKGIAVSWYISPEVPERIWSERRYLLKSLTNIVENAVKFTAVGSVLVTACMKQDSTGGRWLQIEVLDTGLGVRSEARERIFESFSQASPDILHIFGGAGLGLSVSRRMIESLGGKIGVDSIERRGSSFWFELPVMAVRARKESFHSLAGTTVAILTSDTTGLVSFAGRLEKLGATTFLSERVDWWDVVSTDKLDQTNRVVVMVDGRNTNLSELGHVLQEGQFLDRVPMIALTVQSGMPDPSIRRRFVTAISPNASDEHLFSALYLVEAFAQERRMKSREMRQGDGHSASPPASNRNRILVADTNRTSILILSKVLEQGGYRCSIVESGESALDAAERELFDVIFVNVDKPAIDGLEAVKMLRFQELGMHQNIIIGLTSREDSESMARYKEIGCDDVVLQPIDAKKVLDLVARLKSQRSQVAPVSEQASNTVQLISSHPRFRVNMGPPIADHTFPYLAAIGGVSLIDEVVCLFISDAEHTLAKLADALERDDVNGFRNGVMSLGESSAVIGADKLTEMCKTAGVLGKNKLALGERALLASLRSEVVRVVEGIKSHLPASADPPSSAPDDVKPGKF
jgi:two-component system sensor histidine kinase RpfC